MTKHKFKMPDGNIMTSTVMSEEEFTELLDFMKDNELVPSIDQFKKHKLVPLIYRGTKTEPIFIKYQIETQYCSFVIRGYANELMKQNPFLGFGADITTIPVDESEKVFAGSYERLSEDIKKEIDSSVEAVLIMLDKTQAPDQIFIKFISKFGKDAPRKIRFALVDSMIKSAKITLSTFRTAFKEKDEVKVAYRKYLIRLFISCYNAITTTAEQISKGE